jgi:rubrerythrin
MFAAGLDLDNFVSSTTNKHVSVVDAPSKEALMSLQSSDLASPFRDWIRRRYLDRLCRGHAGRAFLLQSLLDAEEADEIGVFDKLLARVTDPELHRLVRRHRDDETSHAQRLRECMDRVGPGRVAFPAGLRVVPFIEAALGGVAQDFVGREGGVMEAYLFLQVLEERAVAQYPLFAEALRPFDPSSARVVAQIAEEEKRHVKYARAISTRYAPDTATLEATLRRFRIAETQAFAAHGGALMRFTLDQDLVEVGEAERMAWRALCRFSSPKAPAIPRAEAAAW